MALANATNAFRTFFDQISLLSDSESGIYSDDVPLPDDGIHDDENDGIVVSQAQDNSSADKNDEVGPRSRQSPDKQDSAAGLPDLELLGTESCTSTFKLSDQVRARVGISGCIMGDPVRHNAGSCRNEYITERLGRYFQYIGICPEVEIGLGTPRQPIRFVKDIEDMQLLDRTTGDNHMPAMVEFSERKAVQLRALDIDGYIGVPSKITDSFS